MTLVEMNISNHMLFENAWIFGFNATDDHNQSVVMHCNEFTVLLK